jgi:predicted site-specific integrase-resolvase
MTTLPILIPISEAARKYGLEEARLRQLVEKGKIRAGIVAGEMVVSEEEVQKRVEREIQKTAEREQGSGVRKEDLPEYQKYAHLRGKPIWIRKAEEIYGIPNQTLWRWMKAGIITCLGKSGNKVLMDEADVAYCNEIYKQRGKQGRILFNPDGTPYKPKTGSFAM